MRQNSSHRIISILFLLSALVIPAYAQGPWPFPEPTLYPAICACPFNQSWGHIDPCSCACSFPGGCTGPQNRFSSSLMLANFSVNTTSGPAPLTVQFTDRSTGFPASWLWDFGDGSQSNLQNPIHTYTNGGTYTVSLTVSREQGNGYVLSGVTSTRTQESYITVTGPIVVPESEINAGEGQNPNFELTAQDLQRLRELTMNRTSLLERYSRFRTNGYT